MAIAGVCSLLTGAGCRDRTNATTGDGLSVAPAPASSQVPEGWSLDMRTLVTPAAPASGRLGGQEFRPDEIELDGNQLTFRQGRRPDPQGEIKITLSGGAEFGRGFKLEVTAEQGIAGTPHIHASWKIPADPLPRSDIFIHKYALKLELDKTGSEKLQGRIYLCLPDEAYSFLAGTFEVPAASLSGSQIVGRVTFREPPRQQHHITVGFLGHDSAGTMRSGFVGSDVAPGSNGWVSSSGNRMQWSQKEGVTYRHERVPPGFYLVFMTWGSRAMAWRWIEVKDRMDSTVDLLIDPADLGELEVQVTAGRQPLRVQVVPLPPAGQAAPARLPEAAWQLSAYVASLSVEVPAGKDRAEFPGLRAGRYRVLAGKQAADVVVKAKAAVRLEMTGNK
jgi:hypothetical protein